MRTLRNYLTPELWEEVKQARLQVMGEMMDVVDRAVLAKAMKGDVTAAKLIYARWEAAYAPRAGEVPIDVAAIDAELALLEEEIEKLEAVA